ncbi:ATP-independent chaperone, alpha-crystallin/Hsp20 family [Syntrophotalea carbinolica DSM 2380]|uniref:ATP-independent chaperone, alpha-crystallin/Hsp20 family n=1 Tax=Syntrophotalea carbinolica (strain DSM 2380 / NBRC 103641 / GraBd1) TaxID=338963 RepID=Q3A7M7_SYNC1|nr:Hsp20/alpha crystallin family protein [Syntrophotalea carbinolica]ABA87617.1 ATP-independent chaperone, alpha-crystallin/Hsp20 family [Syntrophotalea carbinolica DSM 2380]
MATWNVYREMENLRREIDDAFRGFGGRGLFGPSFHAGRGLRRQPAMNLYGDAENLYVEVLVPGIAPDKLDLTVQENVLTVSGERTVVEDKERTWHRRERDNGKFVRTLELPVDVDGDHVKAICKNGLLTITLPKAAAARPRKISVDVG